MKHTLKIVALLGVLWGWAAGSACAQAPGSGGPTPNETPTEVPLDGGASLLLVSGVAYGLKRLQRKKVE